MKIAIGKAMDAGMRIITKNPVLLVPFLITAVLNLFVGKYTTALITQLLGPFLQGTSFPGISGVGAQELDDFSSFDPGLPVNPDSAQQALDGMMSAGLSALPQILPLVLIVGLVTLLMSLTAIKMMTQAQEGAVRMGEAMAMALKKLFVVVIAEILYGLMVGIGTILLVVPGLIIAVRLYYFPYAVMVDNQGVTGALSTSWNLTKGNWWRSVGLFVIIGIATVLLMGISSMFPPLSTGYFVVSGLTTLLVSAWATGTLFIAYLQMKGETV